jgi:hypothetical protein
MAGDYTRFTFKPQRDYTGVLKQQGRVDLDADCNELIEIIDRRWRSETIDIISHCIVPNTTPDAFLITPTALGAFNIGIGRMYVDGIQVENHGRPPLAYQADLGEMRGTAPIPYDNQPYLPASLPPPLAADANTTDLIYIDVWQREVTVLEEPTIREIALGGPDTTTRLQAVWQVRVLENVGRHGCSDDIAIWDQTIAPSAGRLTTSAVAPPASDDPCIISPTGGYRGLENRLYRVQIHSTGSIGGAAPAKFKWSRNNATIASTISAIPSSTEVTIQQIGRDQVLRFEIGNWIEITDDFREFQGLAGHMAQITAIDEANRILTFAPAIPGTMNFNAADPSRHTRVQRWDQSQNVDANGLLDVTGGPIDIENGIRVNFSLDPAGGNFKIGDYWVFTARTADGSVEILDNAPPRGILHHYCRLGFIHWGANIDTTTVTDCRGHWPPKGECGCCTVTVGDGVRSVGDFTDIQAAIDALDHGGRVCILPGEYLLRDTVVIQRNDVIVSGCGRQTHIGHSAEGQTQPGFRVQNCARVAIEALFIEALNQDGAILVRNSETVRVADCLLRNSRGPALRVSGSSRITIEDNTCEGGRFPNVSLQAQEVRVADNHLEGTGLWLRDGSSAVVIQGNVIIGGLGPGIGLGGLEEGEEPSDRATGIAVVEIIGNHISRMSNSGVTTVVGRGEAARALGDIEDITITGNRIVACALHGPSPDFETEAVGGVVLRDVARLRIHDNYIADNGAEPPAAACGLFVTLCQGLEVTDNTIINNGAPPTEVHQCIDFSTMPPGPGPNPRTEQDVTFTVRGPAGGPQPQTEIRSSGTFTGLDCSFLTEITLPSPTTRVELTLVHTAIPARIEAFNTDNSSAGTATMSGPPNQAETLSLTGSAIQRVVVTAPQNETLLLEFCVVAEEPITSYQGGIIALFVTGDALQVTGRADAAAVQGRFQAGAPAALIHDNVVVCPRGQALLVVGLGPLSVADNTLTSQGIRNQPEIIAQAQLGLQTQIGRCVYIYNLGRTRLLPAAVSGFRGNIGTHLEFAGVATPETLRLMPGVFQREFPDGRVLFHGNQVTLQVAEQLPEPLLLAAVALISLDDVSLQDNQILAEAASEILFTDVLAWSPILRASSNRFTELPLRALYSYFSVGQSSNIATNNQATHCLFVGGSQPIAAQNYEMFTANCQRLNGFLSDLGVLTMTRS